MMMCVVDEFTTQPLKERKKERETKKEREREKEKQRKRDREINCPSFLLSLLLTHANPNQNTVDDRDAVAINVGIRPPLSLATSMALMA
jgi:hypothetical protein